MCSFLLLKIVGKLESVCKVITLHITGMSDCANSFHVCLCYVWVWKTTVMRSVDTVQCVGNMHCCVRMLNEGLRGWGSGTDLHLVD